MSDEPELTEEEIRQLQAELDRVHVDDVLLQTVVSLLNLGARRAGLADPSVQPDMEQTRIAIEGARALLPLLEQRHADKLGPIRDMLAQLQLAYAQVARAGGAPATGGAAPEAKPDEPKPGPAQSSGRLWVPGQ